MVSHRTAPDFASSAIRCPCTVPKKIVSSRIATPRLTGGDPMTMTSVGIAGVYVHSGRPVRTSSAVTVLGGSVRYMTPSATIGEVLTMPVRRT